MLPGPWIAVHPLLLGPSDRTPWATTVPGRFAIKIRPAAAQHRLLAGLTRARESGAPLADPRHLEAPPGRPASPSNIGADIQRSLAHPGWLAYDQITPLRTRTSAAKSAPLQPARLALPIGTASGIPLKSPAPSTSRARAIWVNHLGVDPMSALRAATCWPRPAMKVDQDVGPPP